MEGSTSEKADPADIKPGERWKSYLTVDEQETVLQEALLIQQGFQPKCHRSSQDPAIFWAPVSENDVKCKLAEVLAALQGGANPNEEESEPILQKRSGRPLDLCLDCSKAHNFGKSNLNNLPVIQMLLDYGADPRLNPIPQLKQAFGIPCPPLETARRMAELEELESPMKEFYKQAYEVLKRAADRLESLSNCEKAVEL